jgi:virginiamycin B lyase
MFDPHSGSFTIYTSPTRHLDGKPARTYGIAYSPSTGIWFALWSPKPGKICNINLITGAITEYTVPGGGHVWKVAVDRLGRVWYTEPWLNRIGVFDPATGEFKEYELPTPNSYPHWVAVDRRHRVWVTEYWGNKLAMFDPRTEMFEEYPIPTSQSGPNVIAFDYRGNVWFTETGLTPDYRTAWNVAMFDVSEKVFREYTVPTAYSAPAGIAFDPRGGIWFTEFLTGKIGQLSPLPITQGHG